MIYQKIIKTLAIAACFLPSLSLATLTEEMPDMHGNNAKSALEIQVENVASFIANRKENQLPVKMVMGAKNTECTRITSDLCKEP